MTSTQCLDFKASAGNMERCINCHAGQFQNSRGQFTCKNCPEGTFQTDVGQPTCADCGKGRFQDREGAIGCKSCPSCKHPVISMRSALPNPALRALANALRV